MQRIRSIHAAAVHHFEKRTISSVTSIAAEPLSPTTKTFNEFWSAGRGLYSARYKPSVLINNVQFWLSAVYGI